MKKLNLYILRLRPEVKRTYLHDAAHGFIICATTTNEARNIAASQAGDEKSISWLSSQYSTCGLLASNPKAKVGVVLCDFNAG